MNNQQARPIGRVLIMTGEGKGKTTAALGVVLRAVGRGMKVAIFQFIKGRIPTGELKPLEQLGVPVHRLGSGYSWRKENLDQDRVLARKGWDLAAKALASGDYQLVVLDEINYVLGHGMLDAKEVAGAIKGRPGGVHLILTGRGLDPELAGAADTITEMKMIKHAHKSGVKATPGIEF